MNKTLALLFLSAALCTTSMTAPARAEQDKLALSAQAYEDAIASLEKRNLNEASVHLRNAIKYNPDSLPAYLKLAELYLQLGQPANTEWTLNRLRAKNVDLSLYAELLAQAYFTQSRYEELLEALPALGLPIEMQARVTVWRGRAYLALRKFNEAESAFMDALVLRPNMAEAHLQLSRLRVTLGEYPRAEEALAAAKREGIDSAEYHYLMGELHRQRGQLAAALPFYENAIAREPAYLAATVTRAGILLDLKKTYEAEKEIEKLHKQYPSDLHVAYLYTLMLSQKGDKRGASASLEKTGKILDGSALIEYQDDPRTLIVAGAVYYFLGRYEDSINALKQFIILSPHDNEARRLLASAQLQFGMPRDALLTLRDGLYYEEHNLPLLELLGRTFMELGRHEEAAETYEFLTNNFPKSEALKRELALAKFSTGKRSEAVRTLEEMSFGNKDDLDSALVLANLYIRNQDFKKAIEHTTKLKEKHPKVPLLYNISASAHLALGEDDLAREDYLRAIALAPRYLPALFNLASLDLKQNRIAAAQQLLNRIVEYDNGNHMAMIQLSRIAESQHDLSNAVRWLERALTDYASVDESLRLANLHLKTNNLGAAATVVDALTATNEDNIRVIEASALIKAMQGDINRAQSLYRQMTGRAVNNADTLYWLHRIARRQKDIRDIEAARDTMKLALEYDANNLRTHTILAELDMVSHRYDAGLTRAEKLITLAPDHPVGYSMTADILLLQDKPDLAMNRLDQGLTKMPRAVPLALRKYKALTARDGSAAALDYLEQWETEQNTLHPSVLQALGAAYTHAGEYKKAVKINGYLVQSDPNNPIYLNNLAALYVKAGDPRALQYAELAYERAPDNPAIMDTLGWILTRSGKLEKGLSLLRNAHSRAPANAEIAYHTAVALNQAGYTREAIETLRRALALGQSFDEQNDATALLEKLQAQL